ncbi:universal stress protein [Streptomyces sp. Ag109_O5-10]|uniref:universal stress protein n=1 Tax=Streptomyces sp. Ag109_O5-10 TaxID=1855349 RepID=UPI0008957E77|nr:universal stress protein [Streptomyces sp. Ag109_O5-10]SED84099.1 Universal stress protein family protein [Streptomyces sp. Ag109_O5-10]
MEPVILARSDASKPCRAAVDWAAREAEMRGVVLRVPRNPLREPGRASVIVCGVAGDDGAPPLRSGSLSATLVGAAHAPVVLVPDRLAASRRRTGVTLGVDARDPSGAGLGFAFESARLRGVPLHVVHVWGLPAGAVERPFGVPERDRATWEDHEVQLLADALRPWREKFPDVRVLEDVRLLGPVEALLRCSERAALVVVPCDSGATVWEAAARALLRRATCAVAVVPS